MQKLILEAKKVLRSCVGQTAYSKLAFIYQTASSRLLRKRSSPTVEELRELVKLHTLLSKQFFVSPLFPELTKDSVVSKFISMEVTKTADPFSLIARLMAGPLSPTIIYDVTASSGRNVDQLLVQFPDAALELFEFQPTRVKGFLAKYRHAAKTRIHKFANTNPISDFPIGPPSANRSYDRTPKKNIALLRIDTSIAENIIQSVVCELLDKQKIDVILVHFSAVPSFNNKTTLPDIWRLFQKSGFELFQIISEKNGIHGQLETGTAIFLNEAFRAMLALHPR